MPWLLTEEVPVAVTVKCELPVAAPDPLVKVRMDDPFPGEPTVCGLKVALTPEGNPETANATDELNPPSEALVSLSVPFVLELTVTLIALGVSESPGTFSVTACFSVALPPLAVSVTG